MDHPHELVTDLEHRQQLDGLVSGLESRIPAALRRGPAHDQLAGAWLGHALHPVLTDIPLGTWMSATILDLVDARAYRRPSAVLTGVGLAAAVPTVASGIVEWLHARQEERRVGVLHAMVNSVGAGLYATSLVAKLSGRTALGRSTAVLGGLAAIVGGFLGGHLSFARGVGMDRTRRHWGSSEEATFEVDIRTDEAGMRDVRSMG